MTQYEEANAARSIDGYYFPTPHEDVTSTLPAVERARNECIMHLKSQIHCIQTLSAEKFYLLTKRKSGIKSEAKDAA